MLRVHQLFKIIYQERSARLLVIIQKTLKKLECGGVGFAAKFLSSLAPCTRTIVARSRQKNLRSRLAKFQLFKRFLYIIFGFALSTLSAQEVMLGVDVLFQEEKIVQWKGKRIGLITNHTGVDRQLRATIDRFLDNPHGVKLVALFSPEHGINGHSYAAENVPDQKGPGDIPIYSLHGKTRRPTPQMLKGIDMLVYDIQDIGCRSYTYTTTLFYAMEEAAKQHIPFVVLDRPNPLGGLTIEGPMLNPKWRSFIGYVNVPYCHGMTIGELARFFNEEYQIGCALEVIAMKGWKRSMHFAQTGLTWIPTSPNIPEPQTPLFCATTGIIGELGIVSVGIGTTLPFKILGAPWIKAKELARTMNEQQLPGVFFYPYYFRPFFGLFQGKECEGILILATNYHTYRPLAIQYMLLGILNLLYPKQMQGKLASLEPVKKELFCKANGNEEMLSLLCKEKYVAWKLISFQKEEREQFRKQREKYLLYTIPQK